MGMPLILNQEIFYQGVEFLSAVDTDLAELFSKMGPPPLWERKAGFATLVHIILEQQVSLASAKAAFIKLQQAVEELTPGTFLELDDEELKSIGFSRQKIEYCRNLALSVNQGKLDLDQISKSDDHEVRSKLTELKGIGPWTAEIYLLMALLRPDAWPNSDLALAISVQDIKKLATRPTPEELNRIAMNWQPWRAVAARMLWFSYLQKRGLV